MGWDGREGRWNGCKRVHVLCGDWVGWINACVYPLVTLLGELMSVSIRFDDDHIL